jgi:PAS domain S-box-containing protein
MSIRDYEPILEVLADAIVASDDSGCVRYVNPAGERLLGLARSELIGKPLTALMPSRMHAPHEAGFRRYAGTRQSRIFGRPVRVPAIRRDGVEIDVELTLSSVTLQDGKEMIIASLRDLRERVELERQVFAQQRLAAQNAAMNVFVSARSVADASAGALRAIGENLAWSVGNFWLVEDGRLRWQAGWHAQGVEALDFIARSKEMSFAKGEGLPGRAWEARKPVWVFDMQAEPQFPRRGDAAKSGLRGAFAFPVVAGQSVVAVVEFFDRTAQAVDEELLQSVATLGGQIGQCVERIQAQAQERVAARTAEAARVAAERAEQRASFLAESSAVLAQSLEYEQTLRRVGELAVPAIADWCTITAIDDNGIWRRVAVAHRDPSRRALVAEYEASFPPGDHRAGKLSQALKTGTTILQASVSDADLAAAAQGEGHLRILRGLGCSSCVMVPMRIRSETVGVISLMRGENGSAFDESDVLLAEQLSQRAAVAIDNARLYRAAQREQSAMRFLAEASALLNSSLDSDVTLQQLAQLVVPRFADWCAVDLVEDGEIRSVAVAHADPAKVKTARELRLRYPRDPRNRAGVPNVLRTGRSEIYEEIPDQLLVQSARDEEHLRIMRELRLRSVMIVPLVAIERSIGGLTLVWAESDRRYTRGDLVLMEELGRRAGSAVENARLYQETQRAVHLRDEFLAVASHELKTPLTSLQLQVEGLLRTLARQKPEAMTPERLLARASTVDRQLQRLGKLVNGLLDVTRASAAPLQLELEDVDLAKLVREVIGGFEDDLANANCRLELRLDESLVGVWDRMRLGQVITNLVSNAIKYGPGKPIEVVARAAGDKAVLSVRDQGIGIAPADQRRIFERFARAVSAEHYSGLGLGLWIVRILVEAMGGTVRVTSRPGEGSTFEVELGLRRIAPHRDRLAKSDS